MSDQGTAPCPDAKTGETKWSERLPGTDSASLLVRGDTACAFADDGRTVQGTAGGTFGEVGRNQLGGRVRATPAAATDGPHVRTDAALHLLTGAKPPAKK